MIETKRPKKKNKNVIQGQEQYLTIFFQTLLFLSILAFSLSNLLQTKYTVYYCLALLIGLNTLFMTNEQCITRQLKKIKNKKGLKRRHTNVDTQYKQTSTLCLVGWILGGMENIEWKMGQKNGFSSVWEWGENRRGAKPGRKFSLPGPQIFYSQIGRKSKGRKLPQSSFTVMPSH